MINRKYMAHFSVKENQDIKVQQKKKKLKKRERVTSDIYGKQNYDFECR